MGKKLDSPFKGCTIGKNIKVRWTKGSLVIKFTDDDEINRKMTKEIEDSWED